MKLVPLSLAAALLMGAAVVQAQPTSPQDPLERVNRSIFDFNEGLDRNVLQPVASGYRKVVPSMVRTGVGNFIGNFGDAWSAINQFLQGKPSEGVHMGFRVLVNTTLGLGGILDWGTELGLERQSEDFGQTLGRWGLGAGPYLVLPVLGPSSVRDAGGLVLDLQATPSNLLFDETSDAVGASVLQVIHRRSELLDATRVVDDIALDKYQFIRDGYLARRRSQVYDGNPPEERQDEDDDGGTPDATSVQPPAAPQAPASAPAR